MLLLTCIVSGSGPINLTSLSVANIPPPNGLKRALRPRTTPSRASRGRAPRSAPHKAIAPHPPFARLPRPVSPVESRYLPRIPSASRNSDSPGVPKKLHQAPFLQLISRAQTNISNALSTYCSMSTSQHASSSTAVPSPTADFATFLPHITSALDALTTHAASLPGRSDLAFHRTLDRKFAKELDVTSARVLGMTERLLALVEEGKGKVAGRRKLKDEEDVVDGYRRGVSGVVDGLLEDADASLDELNGQNKKAAIAVPPSLAATTGVKLPGPFSATNTSRELAPLNAFAIAPANIPKPQLRFSDPVDNSLARGPWRPSITTKVHGIVPLDYEAPLDYELTPFEAAYPQFASDRRSKEIRFRQHPYFYETRNLVYPPRMFDASPPSSSRPMEESECEFVDTPEKLEEVVGFLKEAKEIAVDLEHHDLRSYYGFTCLMQISTRERDWVIDTLALRKELREGKLGGVMVDPAILKVFHGSDSDIVWLQKDFEIYIVNLFDTYHATHLLGFPQHSLASLLQKYSAYLTDKRYQRADWRIRPLPEEMMHYARSDTHFLLSIYDHLRNALLEQSRASPPTANGEDPTVGGEDPTAGGENPTIGGEKEAIDPQQAMREVLRRSADTALKLYEREGYDEETGKGSMGWLNPSKKWMPIVAREEQAGLVFKRLHALRDRIAREEDESPYYVMPMESLKGLAMRSPAGLQAIRSIIGTTRSSVVSRRGVDEVLKVINDAKAEWRAIGSKPTVEPSTPVAIDADPVAVEPEIEPPPPPAAAKTDIWDHVGAPAAKSDTSSLFGAALKSAATKSDTSSLFGAALTPAATKSHTSSLFGSVLNPASTPTTKKSSTLLGSILSATNPAPRSSFADVQRAVHADLEPKIAPPVETAPPPAPTPKATLPAPETVPFVPSGSRTTIVMPVQPDPEVMDEEEEGVVPVKRKRGKAKNPVGENPAVVSPGVVALTTSSSSVTYLVNGAPTIVTSSPIPSDGPRREQNIGTRNPSASTSASGKPSLTTPSASSSRDASVPVDNENLPPTKPKRAKKIRAEDVPEFDYSHEPNLLDNPGEYKGRGKKVKTSKKERTKPSEITPLIEKMSKKDKESHGPAPSASGFGRTPQDKSQPKEGNRSGTFA